MARTSKKDQALQAALKIIECDGIPALTYESLAEATGMSKSGLIYHFPSRHEMLIDIHAWSAQRWEEELVDIAGAPYGELDAKQRLHAVVLSLGKNDPLVELILSIHTKTHEDFAQQWVPVESRWMPDASDPELDPEILEISFIAHGLWVYDHISQRTISAANRKRLVDSLINRIAAV